MALEASLLERHRFPNELQCWFTMITNFMDNIQTFSMKLELVGLQNKNPRSECAGLKFHLFSEEVRSLSNGVHEDFWKFLNDSTTKLLSKMSESYPWVADVPVRPLLMFPSTYRCKQGFLAMFCIKIKCCALLCMKEDLHVSLSKAVI